MASNYRIDKKVSVNKDMENPKIITHYEVMKKESHFFGTRFRWVPCGNSVEKAERYEFEAYKFTTKVKAQDFIDAVTSKD